MTSPYALSQVPDREEVACAADPVSPLDAVVRAGEGLFRLLAENASDVVVLADLTLRRLYVSPAARAVLGYEPGELVGTRVSDFVHPDDAHLLAGHWSRVRAAAGGRPEGGSGGLAPCSLRHRHKDGHYVWIEASVRPVDDRATGRMVGCVAALRDVTARRDAEDRVRHMALHDALTGLPNRTLFRDRLDQAVARVARERGRFALLMCDLDRFKAVNDGLGHPAGDALLRVVAERMKGVLRPYDTVARLGGDEFAVVVADLDAPGAATAVAGRLIAAVSEPVDLDGRTVEVGVSIGLTIATEADRGADELVKRADMALYEAKGVGGSACRAFCPDVGARAAARDQLGLDMKAAIRHGAFRLAYQPVVDARTGRVVGLEALMRWRHPVRGELPPGAFIPLAEETGLIVPLGNWALLEACRAAAGWPDPVRVAVNLSAVQFRRDGLEAAVVSALAASGLHPSRLTLEVTESVLMQDADGVLSGLRRLRALGVCVALDDFGAGHSSLGYLRRFPFDAIKIDRAVIRDIADPDAAAIVRAVAGIGERLGMGIVAEGVETDGQLDRVRREGCTQAQGFLFGRPLSPEEARAYLRAAGL